MKEILIAIGKVVFPSLYRAGLADEETRLTAARADREELELRVRRGELVEKQRMIDKWKVQETKKVTDSRSAVSSIDSSLEISKPQENLKKRSEHHA